MERWEKTCSWPSQSCRWISNCWEQKALGIQELIRKLGRAKKFFLSVLQNSAPKCQKPKALGHRWSFNFVELCLWPRAWNKILNYILKKSKEQTWKKARRKQETWNKNQGKKQIMKGHKNKGKNKELEGLPPSSLMLACLLPPQS